MSNKDFGAFIKACRVELGFTQEYVVDQFQASAVKTKSAYSKYENGAFSDISPEMLKELCMVLKLDYSETALRLMIERYEPKNIEEYSDLENSRWNLMKSIVERKSSVNKILDADKDVITQLSAHEINAHTKALTKNIMLDMDGLALWEKNLKGPNNFWIASPHVFDGAGNAFFKAMVEQLKRGSRYTFFIPEDLILFRFATVIKDLKKHLKDSGIESDPEVRAIPLNEKEVWEILRGSAYVIANPTSHSNPIGFICPINDHTPQIAYEMRDVRLLTDYLGKLSVKYAGPDSELMSHVTNP